MNYIASTAAGGPILFGGFKSPLSSFAMSAVIGVTAGLSNADDTAVQLAIFTVWLRAAAVIGMPSHEFLYPPPLSFVVNLVSIAGCAVVACAALHLRGGAG